MRHLRRGIPPGLFAVALLLAAPRAGADTLVSGTISTNTTWTVAGSPYILTGPVYISGSPTPTLTIQAGVTVKGNSGANLVISYPSGGVLQALGTVSSPILFTANGSTTPGFWVGVYLGNLTATASQISYATVEYGGVTSNNRGGLHVEGSSPTIDHVTVRNSLIAGITVNGGSPTITASTLTGNSGPGLIAWAGSPSISGSTITNNSGYAMSAATPASLLGLSGLTVSGNGPGKDLIERQAGTITVSQTWVLTTIPYVVTGSLYVEGSPMPVLTIQAGVTVKFNSLSQLVVNYNTTGALQAVGTAASPILFTANGSTTPGFWYGLYFGQTAGGATASQIAYATVEYGGLTQYSRGGIHVWNCSPTFDHLTLRNNQVAGISIDGGSTTITNTAFSGNPAGLTKTATPATVTARFNYWGAASGPSGGGPGTGQSVAAGVTFEPWLIASPSQPQFFNSFSQKNRTFNPTISVFTTITAGTTLSGNWTFSILNSGGTTIRTFSGSGVTGSAIWDGKNSSGVVQANGTYSYQLASSAPGGTATIAQGIAVIDTTKQVAISNLAVDQPFFSPNGDGVKDTVTVTGTNSFDDSTITVNVKNSGGTIVRTNTSIGGNFSYTWDGKNASSVVQPDGSYTFEVVATNGSASGTSTISTTLDNTPPVVTITAPTDGQILSNVYNNGATDVSVTGSATDLNFTNWSLDYGVGSNPSSFTALGSGTTAVSGATLGTWATLPLTDGIYTLRLQAWDKAGNRGIVQIRPNIENFSASLNANQLSTAAGGTVTVSSIVPFALTETVTIKNGTGQVVRTLVNAVARTAATYSDIWNGKNDSAAILPDGPYFYVASVTDGTHSLTWDLSNQFINDGYQYGVSTGPNYDLFNNRPLSLTYNFSRPGRVSVGFSPSGDPATGCPPPDYCLLLDKYEESGPHTVYFSGADATGKLVGTMIQTAAWSLRSNFAKNAIVVYGTSPTVKNVTVTPAMYGPAVGSQSVAFDLTSYQNQTVTVTIAFVNQASVSALRTLTLSNQAPGHVVATWDGKAVNGMWVAPGFYTVIVTATDSRGNTATGQILTTVLY